MIEQQKTMIIKEVMELPKLKTEWLIQGDENRYLLIPGILWHLEPDLNGMNLVENRIQRKRG